MTTMTTKTTTGEPPGVTLQEAGRRYALHMLRAVWIEGRELNPHAAHTLNWLNRQPDLTETALDVCIRLAGLPPLAWRDFADHERAGGLAGHIEKHEAAAAQGHPRT